jgi:two-component system NtrC family sensor kinase
MLPVKRLRETIRGAVRYKLLALVLFPILLVIPVTLFSAFYWGKSFYYDQLFIKVNTDLSVAHDVFKRLHDDYLNRLARLAESHAFFEAMQSDDVEAIKRQIAILKNTTDFDYLNVLDADGKLMIGDAAGYDRVSNLLRSAARGNPSVGIEIFDQQRLAAEDSKLAQGIVLPLVETERAVPTSRTVEDRGMVLRAIYPATDAKGRVVCLLDGGVLLNSNFGFVDTIRDLVYGHGSLPAGSIGTVTVFLDDVRVSTNVALNPGERALGTRVSSEVREHVLEKGEIWINSAFVVNDWYISAYEPIVDINGERVGMLYAGYLEAPFRLAFWKTLAGLMLLFVFLMMLSAWLSIKGAKTIFKPLEAMSAVVRATREGRQQRIGPLASTDEIGELSRELDVMLDLLQQRSEQTQEWAAQLEVKVAERTAELEHKNIDLRKTIDVLQKTRQQLVLTEKMAALGELTAGVAHEINNPAQVILGNLDVVIQALAEQVDPVSEEIELIVQQVYRIQDIINNLLQYARPGEYAGYLREVQVNSVVDNTVRLLQHMRQSFDFELEFDLEAKKTVRISEQDLEQVLVNLLVNAIHAVPRDGGKIFIRTRDWRDKGVVILIKDNGSGMDQEKISHVFNPFYTTKKQGEGTGLGLSISYGLIRRYGGSITVESSPGGGAEFYVWLLSEPVLLSDEETISEQLHEMESVAANVNF